MREISLITTVPCNGPDGISQKTFYATVESGPSPRTVGCVQAMKASISRPGVEREIIVCKLIWNEKQRIFSEEDINAAKCIQAYPARTHG
jgi:hypothetical protein